MSNLVSFLNRFNRKERFLLLRDALFDGGDFRVGQCYARKLGKLVLGDPIPNTAFVAMDFHLDWLHVALELNRRGHSEALDTTILNDDPAMFRANQQDIDLLVVFAAQNVDHVVLVEAKATSGWSSSQLNAKAERLGTIFGKKTGDRYSPVKPYFVLTSPGEPPTVKSSNWPQWMLNDVGSMRFLQLRTPNRTMVSRLSKKSNKIQFKTYKGNE